MLIAESEPQDSRLAWPIAKGGSGLDGLWNDDFHHSAIVRLTGRNEAYYTDYLGTVEEFLAVARWGYLFQGQFYSWQKKRRGEPTQGVSPAAFVNYLENHDQVANTARGERVRTLTSPGRWRAMTAFLLLAPGTPMLFQGQEFGATTPFLYFADADKERAKLLVEGRAKFLGQFPSLALPEMQKLFAEPAQRDTFQCRQARLQRARTKPADLPIASGSAAIAPRGYRNSPTTGRATARARCHRRRIRDALLRR